MARKEAATIEFAPRSQASILRQEELETKRARLQVWVRNVKEEIAELEKRRDSVAKSKLEGEAWAWRSLEAFIAELRAKRDLLEIHEGQLREVEAGIAACTPTPDDAAARQENQQALAALAEERLGLDADVDAALNTLRSLLEQRGELRSRMTQRAQALELDLDLDQERFDALAASLPEKMERRSRTWAERFLGRPAKPVRAFARGRVVVPETLAQAGIYSLGDELVLSEEEFAELRRTDRPAPTTEAPWRCQPRGVFTPAEYEEAQREAEGTFDSSTVADIISRQDAASDQENKARWEARMTGLVKVKVLRADLIHASRMYVPGQTAEIPFGWAKQLAASGQVELLSASE